MDLSRQLQHDAIAAGLCDPHAEGWKFDSAYDLIEYYKANPDWCLERKFPEYELLQGNFNTPEAREQGVYVGQENLSIRIEETTGKPVNIFNQCSGTIFIGGWTVARVYVALKSKLKFIVEDDAVLILDYYDNSEIEIINNSSSPARVYQYGNKLPKIRGKQTIRIVSKHGQRKTL